MCLSVNVMCIPQISVNIHRPFYNFFVSCLWFCLGFVHKCIFADRYKAHLTFKHLSLSNPVKTFFQICLIFEDVLSFTCIS